MSVGMWLKLNNAVNRVLHPLGLMMWLTVDYDPERMRAPVVKSFSFGRRSRRLAWLLKSKSPWPESE